MYQKLRAIYHEGAFLLQEPCDLPEGVEVELIVQTTPILPPEVTDLVERGRILQVVTQRMKQNPIPGTAPRFTREELHERR
jgi:predicted DNA-binding antitoxin AbrB/MazE fold protein